MASEGDRTAEDILGLVKSTSYTRVKTARIFLPPQDLVDEHEALTAKADAARQDQSIDSNVADYARQLAELEDEFEEHYVAFRFRALPRRQWVDLLAAHPPTKEQRRDDPRAQFNPETFPAHAIAACLVSPEMTVEQVSILENGDEDGHGGLNDSQFNVLFNTCVEANVGGLAAPKSIAAGAHRLLKNGSEPQPTTTELPDLSSLDG